jgi:hypothetical protein
MKTPEHWTKGAQMAHSRRIAASMSAALLLLAPGDAAARRWEEGFCLYSLADVADRPRFEDYPAARPPVARSAAPRLASPDARRYRTRLGLGAAGGPAFAGPYRIAAWGCGAACLAWAIIDARTGRVTFPGGLGTISGGHVDEHPLVFRADSRLLVVLGAPEEDETREGALFLEWTGTALRRLRFVPAAMLCGR